MRLPAWLDSPARISVSAFAVLILVGTALLSLPLASVGKSLPLVDALFTSTSASCVTGLVVVDTGRDLTLFGQVVVLALIQTGGLGILTLSTLFLLATGRRLSLRGRGIVQDTFTHSGDRQLPRFLLDVLWFTLVIEGMGAALLFLRFVRERSAMESLYLSVFHSVSGFCNAGFALFPDSMMSFRGDWLVNLTMCFLIVLGGMGFLVCAELRRSFPFSRRMGSQISLHSKLVLTTTVALILSGGIMILAMEWRNTMAALSLPERFLASLFQSVTARTAGFNTLPIGEMANESLFLLALYMFIGGSSGSCAGGIKTGTFVSLVVLGLSRLRGHGHPQVFRRTIAPGSVARASSVLILGMLVVSLGTLLLQVTELGGVAHAATRGKFLELFFEVVSAFGTVGLSTGVTGSLSVAGKLIVIGIMFVGRLGPLAVAVAITRKRVTGYQYVEEPIMIG